MIGLPDRYSFFIDFDEDPMIGGQQAFYFTAAKLPAEKLVGCRIVDFCFDEERRLIITVEQSTHLDDARGNGQ
ncbi:hypothetical protein V5E97_00275 [Singulisphaera sp. Ch08]|uniref:DUF2283 domain-containing protein n=1 Tax=Singulisphaera sp. Ch08 TaxID=3120278 RepID=A0AAU7CGU8_9BACT